MSDLTNTIDTYLAAWSEQDDAARGQILAELLDQRLVVLAP